MTQLLVAVVMWVLVASLLILRRRRTDRSISYASITIAISMTFNVNDIYLDIDRLLGRSNLTTILGDALLMVGLSFLGRGVMKAGDYRPRLARIAVGRPALIVALASSVARDPGVRFEAASSSRLAAIRQARFSRWDAGLFSCLPEPLAA